MLSRRHVLTQLGAITATLLDPIHRLHAAVRPIKITGVDLFAIRLPLSKRDAELGKVGSYNFCRILTDAGIRGFSFAGPPVKLLPEIRTALIGQDLFNIEEHLRRGIYKWEGIEHAVWDAMGKAANLPVHKMLGGGKPSLKLYLTTVWPGKADQSDVSFDAQAEMALKEKNAGFKGMKIRAWRPNPLDDAEACRIIRNAVGPDFAIMFDRTAHAPETAGQKVWDFDTGLKVARAMEKAGAYWLEEPFARNDYASHARLNRQVDLLITGGEGYLGIRQFHEALQASAYDIVQPEGVRSGGIWIARKVAMLAEAYHVPTILHGTMGLRLAGWLQASAAIGAEWQELVFVRPPLLPEDLWSPATQVLNTKTLYTIRDGHIDVPQLPGIGLDVNEEAVERFRLPL